VRGSTSLDTKKNWKRGLRGHRTRFDKKRMSSRIYAEQQRLLADSKVVADIATLKARECGREALLSRAERQAMLPRAKLDERSGSETRT
jgi:hypothetical protein